MRDHDLAHADRLAVLILHGDLALGVRTQHLLLAGVTRFRDQPQDLVGIEDRRRHQVRRFVGGVAEHDALVARALFLVGAGLQRIDALRDIGGLRMQQDFDVGLLPVEAFLLVTDVLDRSANDAFDLVVGDRFRTAGFTGDHHLVGGGERFAGRADRPGVDAGLGAFTEKQIDDLVGNPVANLVRMTLGNRLAGEQIGRAHQPTPCSRRIPAAVYVMYPGMSVATARNDVGFVVKPKPIMLAQNLSGGIEGSAVFSHFRQPVVFDLGDIHRRIPRCKGRRGSDLSR